MFAKRTPLTCFSPWSDALLVTRVRFPDVRRGIADFDRERERQRERMRARAAAADEEMDAGLRASILDLGAGV